MKEISELIRILKRVKVAVATKEIIEQSTCFVFAKGRVYAYNDEISVSCKSPFKNVEGAVSAKELLSFLERAGGKTLSIETTENEMQIQSGRAKVGITLQKEITLPINELGKPRGWFDLPKGFKDALEACSLSCGSDMSKPALTCIHFHSNIAESCDSDFRLSRFTFEEDSFEEGFLLPVHAAKQLSRQDVISWCKTPGWVHFKNKKFNLVFSVRTFEAKFPDLSKFLQVKGSKLRIPKALDDCLSRCSVFAEAEIQKDELVLVHIEDGLCHLRAKNVQGWIEDECKIKYSGPAISFMVNPRILRGSLIEQKVATIGKHSMKFEKGNFEHVVSLMVSDK